MRKTLLPVVLLGVLFNAFSSGAWAENPTVRIETNHGNIDVLLYADKAAGTVANFLAYADRGFYANTLFHRVIDNFMIQGGGYTTSYEKKPTSPAIRNEAYNGLKNEIGTLAMARTGDPHSATAQFFINVNNSSFLDFKMSPAGPLNTLSRSVMGVQDKRTGRLATTNCRGQRLGRKTLQQAENARSGDAHSYECLMQAILADNNYTLERELSSCLARIKQLKRDGKLAADATCSDYVHTRHKELSLVHINWGYAVFGKVIQGMDVVDKIKLLETGPAGPFRKDAPKEPVIIISVKRIQQETVSQ